MADWNLGALKDQLGAAAGKIVGDKVGQAAKPGVDAAGKKADEVISTAGNYIAEKAIAAARVVAISQLPDKIDLAKTKTLETYVEKALNALNPDKKPQIPVDGKPDPATLAALNKVLVEQGRSELASLSDFSKDDLKALNKALEDAKLADGKPNVAAANVLRTCGDQVNIANNELPKPEKKPAPAAAPGMDNNGG